MCQVFPLSETKGFQVTRVTVEHDPECVGCGPGERQDGEPRRLRVGAAVVQRGAQVSVEGSARQRVVGVVVAAAVSLGVLAGAPGAAAATTTGSDPVLAGPGARGGRGLEPVPRAGLLRPHAQARHVRPAPDGPVGLRRPRLGHRALLLDRWRQRAQGGPRLGLGARREEPRREGRRPSASSPGCSRRGRTAWPPTTPAGSASCTSSGTARCGASTARPTGGASTPVRARTATTCTSR